MNTFYGKVKKEDEFCSEYLAFDKVFVQRTNDDPRNKAEMKTCYCGLSANHQACHGSLRFCKFFISIPRIEERKQLIRSKKVCSRCLKTNHTVNSCKSKPASCNNCKNSGKPSSHSPALCLGHNNVSFKALINKMEKEKKEKEKKRNRRKRAKMLPTI